MALVLSLVVMSAALMVFRKTIVDTRVRMARKEVQAEATEILDYIEKYLSQAMINDLPGGLQMHFIGESHQVKFIAPYSPGEGSDLAKFGIYLDRDVVKVQVMRVDRENPDFVLPEGFPGAQPLGRNVTGFTFTYFDGQNWQSSWDTRRQGKDRQLPVEVKVTLQVESAFPVEGKRILQEFTRVIKLSPAVETEEKSIT